MQDVAFEQLESRTGFGTGVVTDPVARAVAGAEAAREAAVAEGLTEGYAAGLQAARANAAPALSALANVLAGFEQAHEEFLVLAEHRAVELAIALAEKVIGEALEVKPELVLSTVAGALRAASERDHLIVEANPADLELIKEAATELAGRVGGVHRLEVVPERRVPRGSCVVRTTEGEIDGRHSEKLSIARDLLRDALTGDAGS
jgi:flagellar biosynthesis/type III secretory pathway protein FliH